MKRSNAPPPVRISVTGSMCERLEAAVSLLDASRQRELSSVVAGCRSIVLRGLVGSTVDVPVYSAATLLAAVEAYALHEQASRPMTRLVIECRRAESDARKVAADWARGDLQQADLLG